MDVQFDEERPKGRNAKTRLYSPNKTGVPTPILEDSTMPIRPQPSREARAKRRETKELRLTTTSKILILLSVFVIAATALFGLFGAAEYAKIVSDTNAVDKEIASYNDQISQIKKTQSSMNDFATINDVCRKLGMTMNWYRGAAGGTDTAVPSTSAPETSAPDGEQP